MVVRLLEFFICSLDTDGRVDFQRIDDQELTSEYLTIIE